MTDAKNRKVRILYIDDERINLQAFRTTFKNDYDILLAASPKEARQILANNKVDIIISDQRMSNESGLDFFESIKTSHPDPIRIILTAYSDCQHIQKHLENGLIYHYLTKPWEEVYVKNIIQNAYEVYKLRKQVEILQKELLMVKQDLELTLRQNEIN